MQEKARVIRIEKNTVSVVPVEIDVCIGCSNSECKKNGSVFSVLNSQNFDIKIGSEVRIAAPVKNTLLQTLFSVGIPICGAALFFILGRVVFPGAGGEGLEVGLTFLGLITGVVIVMLISGRKSQKLAEIVAVLS